MAERRSSTSNRTRKSAAKVIEEHKQDDNTIGEKEVPFHRPPFHRAYAFGLVTGALFLFSWIGQFLTQLVVEHNDAQWQAFGLALFYFWGSSQSKEGDERLEQKIDLLLRDRGIDPAEL